MTGAGLTHTSAFPGPWRSAGDMVHVVLIIGTPSFLGLGLGRTARSAGVAARVLRDTIAHAETWSIELTGTSSGRVVPARPARPPSPSVSTRPGSGCTARGRSAADGCQHVLAIELEFAGPDAREPGELP